MKTIKPSLIFTDLYWFDLQILVRWASDTGAPAVKPAWIWTKRSTVEAFMAIEIHGDWMVLTEIHFGYRIYMILTNSFRLSWLWNDIYMTPIWNYFSLTWVWRNSKVKTTPVMATPGSIYPSRSVGKTIVMTDQLRPVEIGCRLHTTSHIDGVRHGWWWEFLVLEMISSSRKW